MVWPAAPATERQPFDTVADAHARRAARRFLVRTMLGSFPFAAVAVVYVNLAIGTAAPIGDI